MHAGREAFDNVGRRTGLTGLGQFLDRTEGVGRVIFRDHADQRTGNDADRHGEEVFLIIKQPDAQAERGENCQETAEVCAEVKHIRRFIGTNQRHRENGNNREQDTCRGKRQREQDAVSGRNLGQGNRQGNRGNDRTDIGLKQVTAHTGDVTDVIADVIADNRGVSRIVFGNAGFNFTDEVGTDVSGLRVDTAADTTEESDRGSAETEARQNGNIVLADKQVHTGETGNTETDNTEAHNGAAAERDTQR